VYGWVLIILLVLILLAALPAWPYSRTWGYYPGGFITVLLVIVLFLMLFRMLPV